MDSVSDHRSLLHLESLPLIDLRHLAQSELYSLSLCSSSSLSHHRRPDADDLLTPKIDRSVFNESAGSRKQTYSRLRLAPRKSHPLSSSAAAPPAAAPSRNNPPYLDAQIVSVLKKLFAGAAGDDPDLIPVHVDFGDPAQSSDAVVLQSVNVGVGVAAAAESSFAAEARELTNLGPETVVPISSGGGDSERKRKRGRPRKNDNRVVDNVVESKIKVEAKEMEISVVPISSGGGDSERKRKRGRPRKNENRVVDNVVESKIKVEAKEMEMSVVNKNGVAVDMAALCNLEDPFGKELRRRTHGFQNLEQFLEYLDGVKGEWCSMRKKRRVVDASEFGDVLPVGWKLVLCLKKQAGRVWLICSRYISPYGQQFASCKEVSLHLFSGSGFQGAAKREPTSCMGETVDLSCKVNSENAADLAQNGDKTSGDDLGFCSPLPAASTNHVRPDILPLATGVSDGAERGEVLNCHKCTMIYTEKDDLLHHLLTFHEGSVKRSKGNMSVNDEVILKDGKYECQFCHKLFDEKHRYNGHLGVHIKSYVKRVEASVGAGTTQKTVQPGQAGLPPDVSNKQGRAGNDERPVAGTSSASVNPHIEKEDATIGTYTDTHTSEPNLMCEVELTTKAGDTDKTLAVGSCYVQHDICEITDCAMGKGDDSSDVISAKSNVGLAAQTDTMNNDVNDSCGGADAQKRSTVEINNCVVQEGSDNGSISLPGNEKIALQNANGSCISSIEEHEQAKCNGIDLVSPIVEGNTCSNKSTDNMPFTSTTELMDMDDENKGGSDKIISGSGNNCTGAENISSKQQRSSGGSSPFSFGNDRNFDFLNDANGNSTSILAEPVQEKGSTSGLLTSFVDNQSFVLSNKNAIKTSTFDEVKFNKINSSWNKELTIGMAASQTTPGDGSITSNQLERNFSDCSVPCWDEPTCQVRNNTNANCRAQESWNEKSMAAYLCSSSGNDQTTGFLDEVYKHSGGTMDMFNLFGDRKNCEPFPYGSNDTRLGANAVTSTVQGSNSRVTFLPPSSSEQAYIFENHGISNNTPEPLKLDRGYGGVFNSPSGIRQSSVDANNVKRVPSKTFRELEHENVRDHWSSGLPVALDGSHNGLNRNAPTNTLFNDQTFALENNGARIGSCTVEDRKQKRGPVSSFLCLSGGVQNNLNPMYDGMMQESNRFEDAKSMRHNSPNPMVGFGNHVQPNEDVMFELMRRTNGDNALRNGLAGTSSPMLQSSGSFPTFNMMSDKGGTNVNEKMDSMPAGFQGWRSDNMNMSMNMNMNTGHNLEYSFMGAQDGSNSRDKMFSYGSQGGFDSSSGWHHKEALPLLPKIANRYQVNSLCVWCRNEFLHETDDSVTQMSSMGSMCPSCKAKFSGQLSLF